jgi:hypothetical protein
MCSTLVFFTILKVVFYSCSHYVRLFLPDAVVDQLTFFGPVFLAASFLLILLATALGRHAG